MNLFRRGKLDIGLATKVYTQAYMLIVFDNIVTPPNKVCSEDVDINDKACDETEEILKIHYPKIYNLKPTIQDLIQFAQDYQCTVDYLLGITDNPYSITWGRI